jgi:phosphatidylethanolamine/phosphatidyl-N-methylethanolamine N-methyltransferase
VGTGLSLPLYPVGCEVVGIDISEPMLDRARARLEDLDHTHVLLSRMDARAIAYADGHFDKVLAPYVISVCPIRKRSWRGDAGLPDRLVQSSFVNHFPSPFLPLWRAGASLTPISTWIEFSEWDLPIATVTRTRPHV